jgi:DNA polymerase III sliding clamp (beta) subunit (PCNA family)
VLLATDDGRLKIAAVEVGANVGALDAAVQGESGQIMFDVRFLAGAIDSVKMLQVVTEIQSPQNSGVLRPVDADGHLDIVMPMDVR